MSLERHTISVNIAGKEIIFETGKIGRQANGSVMVRCGDTMVFTAATASPTANPETDFLPLRVDYQENFSAVGKTLAGFIKRQGKPSEREVLVSRLIDRPLRPMFEDGYYNEVQVLSYVLSYDGVNFSDVMALCGASAALVISDIPLVKPIAAVRVGMLDGKLVVNPTVEEQKRSKLDLMLAGTEDAVLMIEGFCDFLTEEQILESIETGHRSIKLICETLNQWRKKIGKEKKRDTLHKIPEEVHHDVEKIVGPLLDKALRIAEKQKREESVAEAKKAVFDGLAPEGKEPKHSPKDLEASFKTIQSKYMRNMILKENLRSDNRNTTQIRPIDVESGLLPRTMEAPYLHEVKPKRWPFAL